MTKVTRATLCLLASLALFSTLTVAQPGGNNAQKDTNSEHHSRLGKVAFWRHHKDNDKNTKQAAATKAPSKQAQAKPAQVTPVSAKQTAGNKEPKQHASNKSTAAAKKTPVAHTTKPSQKSQGANTDSPKQ